MRDLLCDLRPSAVIGGPPATTALHRRFSIAEAVARAATGRSLRDLLVDHVKVPLGLRWFDFGVRHDDAALVATNVCSGLPIVPPLSFVFDRLLGMPWDEAVRWSNDERFVTGVAVGNVIVTARDTATFYQCLLDGGAPDGTRRVEHHDRPRRADLPTIDLDRRILLPLHGTGFMLGTPTISLYG
ncbi:MAG: serine hydrolase [Acidimicrobiales bacterium]